MTNAEPEPDAQVRAKVERAWEAFLDGLAAAVVEGLITADREPRTRKTVDVTNPDDDEPGE